jgi:transposase-like protein
MGSVALAQCVPVGVGYTPRTLPQQATMIDFKGHRFEKDIILLCVRWYYLYRAVDKAGQAIDFLLTAH